MTTDRKSVLITGASGFIGDHLIDHLIGSPNAPARIYAVERRRSRTKVAPDRSNASRGRARKTVQWLTCDLANPDETEQVVAETAPDQVVHLAGIVQSRNPEEYFSANIIGCHHILRAASRLARPPRILITGTAAQYGITEGGQEVVDETRPLLANTLYGVSKTIQEQWARQFAAAAQLPVIFVRPFNIMGPGQGSAFVPATFLVQVRKVMQGEQDRILVGNTSTQRDFMDVRDAVAALAGLIDSHQAEGNTYVLASGIPLSIQEILDACIQLSGQPIRVEVDPQRIRANDVPSIIGNARRLRELTGWRPTISWQQSLQDMWHAMTTDDD